jgi:general secretion pathway protein K
MPLKVRMKYHSVAVAARSDASFRAVTVRERLVEYVNELLNRCTKCRRTYRSAENHHCGPWRYRFLAGAAPKELASKRLITKKVFKARFRPNLARKPGQFFPCLTGPPALLVARKGFGVARRVLARKDSSGSRNRSSRAGSALLTVLWLTAALSAIGLAVANNVRGETERAATSVDDVKAYFIAQGAIQRAGMHIFWGSDYFTRNMVLMNLPFPNAEVRVEIIPEASKLSLNAAPPEEILRLLGALGVAEDKAFEITEAILDWRTPVGPERASPFDGFYLSQSPSFLPRHSSFLENEELLLVKGITPDLFFGASLDNSRAGLRDCLSAHARSSAVDVNTARAETLVAVGLTPEDAATIVRNRAEHPMLDPNELVNLQQALGPVGGRLRQGVGYMCTLRATVRLKQPDGKLSDMRRTLAALVKITYPGDPQGKPAGFEVVRWYDRD